MPFFSVVVPAYKNEAYLPDCLDSILSQSFQDWEAIVVVDGSPDGSSDIVRRTHVLFSLISPSTREPIAHE